MSAVTPVQEGPPSSAADSTPGAAFVKLATPAVTIAGWFWGIVVFIATLVGAAFFTRSYFATASELATVQAAQKTFATAEEVSALRTLQKSLATADEVTVLRCQLMRQNKMNGAMSQSNRDIRTALSLLKAQLLVPAVGQDQRKNLEENLAQAIVNIDLALKNVDAVKEDIVNTSLLGSTKCQN